ncbi:MAG: tetratricopeptide repeat protein [Microscillaceae bacterium]|jgi:tetratricopeptide (TPR) repeat protein|nr:tetratricopeptide repeat protein [Microscillaceae bacterium]
MNLTKFLLLALLICLQYYILPAQNLTKSINPSHIQALIDSFRIKSQIEFSFYQQAGDFKDKKILSPKAQQTQRKALEARLKNKPKALDYLNLVDFLADYAPQDSVRQSELRQLAKQALEQQIAQNPQDGEAYYRLGNLVYFLGDRTNGQTYLEKACELMPERAEVWNRWGYLAMDYRNIEVAKRSFAKAVELDIQNLDGQLGYVITSIFESMKMMDMGVNNAYNLRADLSKVELLNQKYPKVLAYETMLHTTKLLEIFYQTMIGFGVAIDSAGVGGDLQSVLPYMRTDTKELQRIEKFIQSALNKRQNNHAILYNALGVIQFMSRQPQKAIEYFEKALQINPKQLNCYYNIAFLQAYDRKNAEALATIQRKMKIMPVMQDYEIAGYLYARMEKWNEALNEYNLGLQKFPEFANLKLGKSAVLARLGRYAESQAEALTGLNLNPNHAEGQYFYALLLLSDNKIAPAYEALQTAKQLGSSEASRLLNEYFEN